MSAHDCHVGNNVVFANNAVIGGHVEIGDYVFLGGHAAVHQFVRVGESVMVAGYSALREDVIPFGYVLHPIGAAGRTQCHRHAAARYQARRHPRGRAPPTRSLFEGEGEFCRRLDQVAAAHSAACREVARIVAFLRAAKRPVMMTRPRGSMSIGRIADERGATERGAAEPAPAARTARWRMICGGGALAGRGRRGGAAARPPRRAVSGARLGRSGSGRALSASLDRGGAGRPLPAPCARGRLPRRRVHRHGGAAAVALVAPRLGRRCACCRASRAAIAAATIICCPASRGFSRTMVFASSARMRSRPRS